MANSESKLKVVVIEDEPSDAEAVRLCLARLNVANETQVFKKGERALEYLEKLCAAGEASKTDLPNLIFLDLCLPGDHGLEILSKIKRHEMCRQIPVIVMSVSELDEDLLQTYRRGGAFFITKPVTSMVLLNVLRQLKIPATPQK